MISGNSYDRVVVVEADSPWQFTSDINGVLQQEPLFYVDSTFIDAYRYKAILVKRDYGVATA